MGIWVEDRPCGEEDVGSSVELGACVEGSNVDCIEVGACDDTVAIWVEVCVEGGEVDPECTNEQQKTQLLSYCKSPLKKE